MGIGALISAAGIRVFHREDVTLAAAYWHRSDFPMQMNPDPSRSMQIRQIQLNVHRIVYEQPLERNLVLGPGFRLSEGFLKFDCKRGRAVKAAKSLLRTAEYYSLLGRI